MKNRSKVIFILFLTLLPALGGCSIFADGESAALEAEALALVRTLQSEPTADPAQGGEPAVALRIPETALPARIPARTQEVIPTEAPSETPISIPSETPVSIPSETPLVIPTGEPDEPVPTVAETVAADAPPVLAARVVNPEADGGDWRELPVIPNAISETVREIYAFGQSESGRNPRFFSKIGDCQSMPPVFLGEYDPLYITTELQQESADLLEAVYYFQGFNELSYAVFNGMSAASALTTTWSDPNVCLAGESAVRCELRIHRPAFVFVNLGTNWNVGQDPEIFAEYLEEIAVEIIETGAVPILSSKTDNVEGDWALNAVIARTAKKYDVPFFNAWRTIQDLPNQGLDPDRNNIYMTTEAWPLRSRAALELLDFLARSLNAY